MIRSFTGAFTGALAICLFIATPACAFNWHATPDNGKPPAMSEAHLKENVVRGWAERAALDIMNFSYKNQKKHFMHMTRYFSKSGWEDLEASLDAVEMRDLIAEYKQTITSEPSAPAEITYQEVKDGRYSWFVTIPLNVTFNGEKRSFTVPWQVMMRLDRTDKKSKAAGMEIGQWVATNHAPRPR